LFPSLCREWRRDAIRGTMNRRTPLENRTCLDQEHNQTVTSNNYSPGERQRNSSRPRRRAASIQASQRVVVEIRMAALPVVDDHSPSPGERRNARSVTVRQLASSLLPFHRRSSTLTRNNRMLFERELGGPG
jgi:hypothetical protein